MHVEHLDVFAAQQSERIGRRSDWKRESALRPVEEVISFSIVEKIRAIEPNILRDDDRSSVEAMTRAFLEDKLK